jgi:NAD(P)-dependent dehydrogenase (short-subunit alcohol dehydrogenase family)
MKLNHVFEGKIAVVTGGASGIGHALCEELAHHRAAMIVVSDINKPRALQVARQISANRGQADARYVDVSQQESVQALIDGVVADFGCVDYMFNNHIVKKSGAEHLGRQRRTFYASANLGKGRIARG